MIETYYCGDDDIQRIKYKDKLVLKTGKEWRVVGVEFVDNDQGIDTMTVRVEKVKGGKVMDWDYGMAKGAQQGWQCPVCKRVYSPYTPMCYYCGGEQKVTVSTGTVPNLNSDDYTGTPIPVNKTKVWC